MKNLLLIILMACCIAPSFSNTLEMEKVVILDAGHGGMNPVTKKYVTKGKRSPIWDQGKVYYEGVGNRDIMKRATSLLESEGYTVEHTVDPNGYVDTSLSKRVRIADKHYLKHDKIPFLISIHSNGYKKESAHGTEVFTSHGKTKSDEIATIWMDEFTKVFPDLKRRTDFDDGDIDKEAKFTILTNTLCPAILIETMFHTNRNECNILMSPDGRQKIAKAICNTVVRVNG